MLATRLTSAEPRCGAANDKHDDEDGDERRQQRCIRDQCTENLPPRQEQNRQDQAKGQEVRAALRDHDAERREAGNGEMHRTPRRRPVVLEIQQREDESATEVDRGAEGQRPRATGRQIDLVRLRPPRHEIDRPDDGLDDGACVEDGDHAAVQRAARDTGHGARNRRVEQEAERLPQQALAVAAVSAHHAEHQPRHQEHERDHERARERDQDTAIDASAPDPGDGEGTERDEVGRKDLHGAGARKRRADGGNRNEERRDECRQGEEQRRDATDSSGGEKRARHDRDDRKRRPPDERSGDAEIESCGERDDARRTRSRRWGDASDHAGVVAAMQTFGAK